MMLETLSLRGRYVYTVKEQELEPSSEFEGGANIIPTLSVCLAPMAPMDETGRTAEQELERRLSLKAVLTLSVCLAPMNPPHMDGTGRTAEQELERRLSLKAVLVPTLSV